MYLGVKNRAKIGYFSTDYSSFAELIKNHDPQISDFAQPLTLFFALVTYNDSILAFIFQFDIQKCQFYAAIRADDCC